MKTIEFGALSFTVTDDGTVALTNCYDIDNSDIINAPRQLSFFEFDVAGGISSGVRRMALSAETAKLKYVSHKLENDVLSIILASDIAEVTSTFIRYSDTNAIRVTQSIKNISPDEICLEMANTLKIHFGKDFKAENKSFFLHKFNNARYTESLPDVRSFFDMGMQWENGFFHVENVGNASSVEYLPQGIIENRKNGTFLMFQIESYCGWVYQIEPSENRFNLHIGGPGALYHNWNKVLKPGASYETVPVAIAGGNSLNSVLAEMTVYRRHIKPYNKAEENLPAIFNEYMHYAWDDPDADKVKQTAPFVAKAGCKYYVVDCGWHESKDHTGMVGEYTKFGRWHENLERFPEGIRASAEYVRSLGMKFGLWIAPEFVGADNDHMLSYYGDDGFFMRNGKKIRRGTGYLLDFRNPKVYDYMSKTLDRMIDEYGCDYIKFDSSPNPGYGTELNSTSLGDGLEEAYRAFLQWVEDAISRHPEVIFEDCSGGGQRIDYKALSIFHLLSTSDQMDYLAYPYISTNILASVLPEQAAIWTYPVGTDVLGRTPDSEVSGLVSEERVVMNMVNAMFGRIHLSSPIHLLDEKKRSLIKEGIDVYNRITPDKLKSTPYLPKGYASYGDTFVASGLKCEGKIYLAVWNLKGERNVKLPLPEISVKAVKLIYPEKLETCFTYDDSSISLKFTEDIQARVFEITI